MIIVITGVHTCPYTYDYLHRPMKILASSAQVRNYLNNAPERERSRIESCLAEFEQSHKEKDKERSKPKRSGTPK